MNITVTLFGTLGQHLPGDNRTQGMDVDIPDGTRMKDLLAHLGMRAPKGVIAASEGRLLKEEDELENGSSVQIFQSVFGG
jgi:sulfur carrier protein ThiS